MGNNTSKNKKENNINLLQSIVKENDGLLNKSDLTNEEQPYFFWLVNDNPDKMAESKENPKWSPYESSDAILIEHFYQKFLKGEHVEPILGEYKINFEKMFQYHYKETWKQRPIIREIPSKVKNIIRKSRFDSSIPNLKYCEPVIIQLKEYEAKTKIACVDDYVEVYFNLIEGKEIKFLILKEFDCILKINFNDYNFESYLAEIKLEMENFSKEINRFNFYKFFYFSKINKDNFYDSILRMYTAEGFLYKRLNKILREKKLEDLKKIKFYYLAMLASFEFCSRTSNIQLKSFISKERPHCRKFNLFRGQTLSKNEIEYYTQNKNSVRIFNEFLSTSLNEKVSREFALKGNCLMKLVVDYEEIVDKNYYALLDSQLSLFPSEREVLLKSGVLVIFSKLEIENSTGLYILNGKVLAFGLKGYFAYLAEKNTITDVYLNNNNLGNNTAAITDLANALIQRDNIKELHLRGNDIGNNIGSLSILTEGIILCKSIKFIDLRSNNLGDNPINLIYLANILNNTSVTTLILRDNSLGKLNDSLRLFSEVLAKNKTLSCLDLSFNNFGADSQCMEVISNALIRNTSISKLNFSGNSFVSNNISNKHFCEIIAQNKFIKFLDLRNSELITYPQNTKLIFDSLIENEKLTEISLRGNNLGSNALIMNSLAMLIMKNSCLISIDLSFNNLAALSKNVEMICKCLISNKNLKEINLDHNNLGIKLTNIKFIAEMLIQNLSIKTIFLQNNNNLGNNQEAYILLQKAKSIKKELNIFY